MKTHSWPDNHWHWPVKLSHFHGVRRGGLIFTGGQADLDAQGQLVHPEDLSAQTIHVLRHVESILHDLDASLTDLIKFVIYFTGDESDEALILKLIANQLDESTRPVVSTVCLPELCYPGMRIELEAIAIDPDRRTNTNPEYIRSDELHPLPEQFSHAVRCNDLILTGDISAIEPDGSLPYRDDVVKQTRLMMEHLGKVLAYTGTRAENVLKLNVFYRGDGTASNWAEPAAVRADFFPEPGPAATGISVTKFARAGMMTKISITAADLSEMRRVKDGPIQYSWPEGHWDWTSPMPYKHGNRYGKLIHLGGQVALDSNACVLHPDDIVAQTKIALQNIKIVLTDLGATMDDIVKVTTFYQGKASAESLHKNLSIRSNAFSTPGPATSGIPVPNLVYENMVIEIEVIAVAS